MLLQFIVRTSNLYFQRVRLEEEENGNYLIISQVSRHKSEHICVNLHSHRQWNEKSEISVDCYQQYFSLTTWSCRPAPGTAGCTLARSAPTNQQSSTTLSPSEVSIVFHCEREKLPSVRLEICLSPTSQYYHKRTYPETQSSGGRQDFYPATHEVIFSRQDHMLLNVCRYCFSFQYLNNVCHFIRDQYKSSRNERSRMIPQMCLNSHRSGD